ncbi:MAG: hypothetical protein Q9220_003132 [cf. Caloplaca sp. 1 TL-2023]
MATKDKMQTTAGSWALLGSVVPRDAFVVAQLRRAGAIILGHASMTEWASLRSSNMVPLTFGTETDGSIAGPAQINSVVGIKPTPGLTSRSGIIPSSQSLDTVGPLARSVRDAVLGLNAIVGPDERDPLMTFGPRRQETDYARFLSDKKSLRGAKFGLPIKRCWENVPEDQKRVATRIFDGIIRAGGGIIFVEYPCAEERIAANGKWDWELGGPSKSEYTVVTTEAYDGITDYLSELSNTNIRSLEDVIQFNIKNRGTEGASPGDHPAFPTGQDVFHDIVATRGELDNTYLAAANHINAQTTKFGIDAALKHKTADGQVQDLDALILCDRLLVGQQIAAQAADESGYPTINVPIGVDDAGIPVSITLQQTAWQEGALIKWASAIEDVRNEILGGRPTPEYKNYLAKNIPIRGGPAPAS